MVKGAPSRTLDVSTRTLDCDHDCDHDPKNVEGSLAAALDRASAAGQWTIMAALAGELQAMSPRPLYTGDPTCEVCATGIDLQASKTGPSQVEINALLVTVWA